MEKEMKLLISKEVEEEMNGTDIEKKYIYMNETIRNSPGLRLNELGEKLELKKETIEHMIECVKKYPCSFHNYGPYVIKDGRYYIQGKDNTIKSLIEENKELKEKINKIAKKMGLLNKELDEIVELDKKLENRVYN